MKVGKILLFFATTILLMALLSIVMPAEGVNVMGVQLYYPSIHSLAESQQKTTVDTMSQNDAELRQFNDSVTYCRSLVMDGNLRFWLPTTHYFDDFWQRAEQAKANGETLRILHYGDSQIEMDHITSRLRAYMQKMFGGGGPGLLPFKPVTPIFTVRQDNGGDLIHLAAFGDSNAVKSYGNYGPMMQSFRLEGSASVTIRAAQTGRVDSLAKQFSNVRLIVNSRGGVNATFKELKKKEDGNNKQVASDNVLKVFDWRCGNPMNGFRINVAGSADLYGLMVDDNAGLAVDNIPMRGCSGQQFTSVKETILTNVYSQMNVGLIIMQFGGNSVPYIKNTAAISTYCGQIGKQIDHLRTCCPSAKILFVGPSDMSTKRGGQMQSYPMLPEIIDSLIVTVNRHGAAYWSIYHAMGGNNSMSEWKRHGLVGSDYIHFSQKGADKMGDLMAIAFDNSYRLYKIERSLPGGGRK